MYIKILVQFLSRTLQPNGCQIPIAENALNESNFNLSM